MKQLVAYATKVLDDDLKKLKQQYFPGTASGLADPFDLRSEFIVLSHNNSIVAAGRITPNPGGPLITETKGLGNFRTTADTVDMGKYLITKEFQGIFGLYETLCLLINEYALKSGFSYGNAGVAVGNRLIKRLERINFTITGAAVPIKMVNGLNFDILPMICDLRENEAAIVADLANNLQSLAERGIKILKTF